MQKRAIVIVLDSAGIGAMPDAAAFGDGADVNTIGNIRRVRGRLELPGRPLLYGTTDAFLRCLNIRSLADLPPLPKNEEAAEQEAPVDGGAEA